MDADCTDGHSWDFGAGGMARGWASGVCDWPLAGPASTELVQHHVAELSKTRRFRFVATTRQCNSRTLLFCSQVGNTDVCTFSFRVPLVGKSRSQVSCRDGNVHSTGTLRGEHFFCWILNRDGFSKNVRRDRSFDGSWEAQLITAFTRSTSIQQREWRETRRGWQVKSVLIGRRF